MPGGTALKRKRRCWGFPETGTCAMGSCEESPTLTERGRRAHAANRVFVKENFPALLASECHRRREQAWRTTYSRYSRRDGAARTRRFYSERCMADRFTVV